MRPLVRRSAISPQSLSLCLGCKELKVCAHKGLCAVCILDNKVRIDLGYKSRLRKDTSHYEGRSGRLPPEPTEFRPGTEEKIKVMAERFANSYCIFHPKDAR